MERRVLLATVFAGLSQAQRAQPSVRGQLVAGPPPAIVTTDGRSIRIDGDNDVRGVVRDVRMLGSDFEVEGRFLDAETFEAAPIHNRPLFVHKNGKRLYVTYWCDVCAIRTYTPGICWCCQENTELDLRERKDS